MTKKKLGGVSINSKMLIAESLLVSNHNRMGNIKAICGKPRFARLSPFKADNDPIFLIKKIIMDIY